MGHQVHFTIWNNKLFMEQEINNRIKADLSKNFDFLESDYKMHIIKELPLPNSIGQYVRVLKNDYIQLELAGNESYFHAEIRCLINGEPTSYSDKKNNIGFEDIAILTTENNYDHFEYYSTPIAWQNVLENTANLFRKSKEIFTTHKWVDIKKIESLKTHDYFKKFGFKPSDKPSFFDNLKKEVIKILTDKGYKIILDNSELPPYDDERLTQQIIFEKQKTKIKISQQDWRDFPNTYFIEINGVKKHEINLSNYSDNEKAVNEIIELLKLSCEG